MAINFPSTPSLNDIHTHSGVSYKWDGSTWKAVGNTSIYTLPTASSTVLGGIKVGSRLTINSGVLEADVQGGTYDDSDVDTHLNQSNPTSGHVLSWNGSDYAWVAADTGASVTVSDNAPAGPSAGDLWWDSDNGRLKVYYTDATPDSQWVDASPLGIQDQSDWNATSGLAEILNKPTLFSGSYTDLTNKPTLFSGSYTDLTNKPTIPSAYTDSNVDTHLNQSNPTSGHVLSWNGSDYAWVAQSSGGSPGGSNTQLQINNNGAFGGCNIEYNPTHLDGGLEWANSSGTPGAAIRVYHSSIGGGDDSMLFYTGGGLLGTINLRIFNNSVTVYGALTKGSGSFRIPHPLPALKDTKDLVHSFIEGPQCDNIYRGKVDLVGGTAAVNLDTKSDMTTGTFVALNRDVQCFTTNETGWTAVKGSVSGNILTITAQDNTCTDTISWMVVGERQDDNIKSSILTDATGKLIIEPNQIPLPPTS